MSSCLVLFACLTVHCYLQSLLHLQRSSCRARLQLNVLLEKGQESRRMQQCIKAKTSTTMVCVRFWSAHPGEGFTILPELLYFHHNPDFLLKLSALLFKIFSMSCIHEHSWHSHFQIFTQPCLHWCQEARYTIGCNIFSEGCIWKGVFCWMKLLTQNCAGTTSFKLLQAFLNYILPIP